MEASNLLPGLDDHQMVAQIKAEAPRGGAVTLAVYDRFSAYGFQRLRYTGVFAALSDFERQEAAYHAATQFLRAILEGKYVPQPEVPAVAFFWTICKRRALGFLRKLSTQLTAPKPEEGQSPTTLVRRTSLDTAATDSEPTLADGRTADDLIAWLDAQLIWDIIRRDLGEHCHRILVETVQKDRPHPAVAADLGLALTSLKTMKNRCLTHLRERLHSEFF